MGHENFGSYFKNPAINDLCLDLNVWPFGKTEMPSKPLECFRNHIYRRTYDKEFPQSIIPSSFSTICLSIGFQPFIYLFNSDETIVQLLSSNTQSRNF